MAQAPTPVRSCRAAMRSQPALSCASLGSGWHRRARACRCRRALPRRRPGQAVEDYGCVTSARARRSQAGALPDLPHAARTTLRHPPPNKLPPPHPEPRASPAHDMQGASPPHGPPPRTPPATPTRSASFRTRSALRRPRGRGRRAAPTLVAASCVGGIAACTRATPTHPCAAHRTG